MEEAHAGSIKNSQKWQTETLVRTKLYAPRKQPNWVPRPQLVEQLNEGMRYPVTLISAPAGFGKTTLLSEWIASYAADSPDGRRTPNRQASRSPGQKAHLPIAWIWLDERDNDPLRFIAYVVAALETLEFGLDENLMINAQPTGDSIEAVLTHLINQVSESSDDFALILDDFHAITAEPVAKALSFVLEHQPPQMHLVISSRVDPPLPLAQLRARGQLLELRTADLRFSLDESSVFLSQKMGLELSSQAIAVLDEHTEGWITGLQLAALSMRGRKDLHRYIKTFSGSHRFIVDYLAEQVLHQQPAHIQAFLLKTSILERLSGPLCEALINGQEARDKEQKAFSNIQDRGRSLNTPPQAHESSQAILEYLEHANLFLIPLDDHRQWYRYNHLFAAFLREKLIQSLPGLWVELHRRAAGWFQANGLLAEAVEHALAVGDNEQALEMVEQIAEDFWMSGNMVRLLGWLQAIPDNLLLARPRLLIFHAWILNITGDYEQTDARLQAAEEGLERARLLGLPDWPSQAGVLFATRAIRAIMNGDIDSTMALSRRALELLPDEKTTWRSVVKRNMGNAFLLAGQTEQAAYALEEACRYSQSAGDIYMALVSLYELAELRIVQGRLHQANELCHLALQLTSQKDDPGLTVVGAIHLALSEVLREWDDLDGATDHAREAIRFGQAGRSLGIQVCGYTRLAMAAQARGQVEHARQAFLTAGMLAPAHRPTSFIAHHDIQARLWWRQGDRAATGRWLQEEGISPAGELSYKDEAAYITLARYLLSNGDTSKALEVLARLEQAAEEAGRLGRLIEIKLLLALARNANGEKARALAELEKALALAAPEGYLRIFLDEGQALYSMLLEVRALYGAKGAERSELTWVHLNSLISRSLKAFAEPVEYHSGRSEVEKDLTLREALSDRELEVLRLIMAGFTNQAIAQELVLAPSTIHWHLKNIYAKLDVHSRTQAVARARSWGLLV